MEVLLGSRLKELREECELTQKEFSTLLNLNSLTYLHYEKAQREPQLSLLIQFAKFYGVSTDYLLGLTNY